MAIVLDASVVVDWALPDEGHPVAEAALRMLADAEGMAPALLWFEVRNALLVGERRGRLTRARAAAFLARLARLPILIDHAPDETVTLDLARTHKLTVYDAAYLELACRRVLPLASLDRALRAAAPALGIALVNAAAA
jgi:predicted nucleic acid-binding protein